MVRLVCMRIIFWGPHAPNAVSWGNLCCYISRMKIGFVVPFFLMELFIVRSAYNALCIRDRLFALIDKISMGKIMYKKRKGNDGSLSQKLKKC